MVSGPGPVERLVRKVESNDVKITIVLILVICVALGSAFFGYRTAYPLPQELTPANYSYITREAVNGIVSNLIISGRVEDVLLFYDSRTRDRQVSFYLMSAAMQSRIPVNLLFALAEWESGYVNSRENSNGNGTTDRGVMMLNSASYSGVSSAQFKDTAWNVRTGAEHFLNAREKYGNWEEAIIAYNAGNTNAVKNHSIRHVTNVLRIERSIDAEFVKRFGGEK